MAIKGKGKDKDKEISITQLLREFDERRDAVTQVPLQQTAEDAMLRYGMEAVLKRALPDWRDGKIPVRRKVMWAMHVEKNHSGAKRQKSAKPVGNTISNYHPHGDISVYGAIVSMVNSPEALLDGEGNWGGPTADAAAMRYTNVRLSKYSDRVFFDRRFLPIIKQDLVDNFDGTNEEPVLLPALLPDVLINGLDAGIAVGVNACVPPFKKEGVKKLVQHVLQGKTLTAKQCYETLEFNYNTGCQLFTDDQDIMDKLVAFFKTGVGSATFMPNFEILRQDYTLRILGTAPMVDAKAIIQRIGENEKSKQFPQGRWWFVDAIYDRTDKSTPHLRVDVEFRKPENNMQFDNWCNDIIEQFSNQVHYRLNLVENYKVVKPGIGGLPDRREAEARFRRFTLVELLTEWCSWRVQLELRALNHEKQQLHQALRENSLKIAIARDPEAFLQALRAADEVQAICKLLTCTEDEAQWLLDRPVRTLTRASEARLLEEHQQLQQTLEGVIADIAAPNQRVLRDLKEL